MADRYHVGNLPEQVLAAAAIHIAEHGPDSLSLREVARSIGVTHGAPAHHFGSRQGLLTALATEGFAKLASALQPSVDAGNFPDTAVEYVRFAIGHPGHYAVMFRADLLSSEDATLRVECDRAYRMLADCTARLAPDGLVVPQQHVQQSAWSLVHGIASLCLAQALTDTDPLELARAAATQLFAQAAQ